MPLFCFLVIGIHIDLGCGYLLDDVVRIAGFTALLFAAAHQNLAPGDGHLLPDLGLQIPTGAGNGRGYVLAADVGFRESFLSLSLIEHLPLCGYPLPLSTTSSDAQGNSLP
ncbi:MAG: hypothetical protein C0630_04715 [Sedimenticola selenatireducens]|uniref:Uncharacterized protein n=1 Tax=Sedimenticola selenatireducens TaxID=191960 RepID=A0A2N6CZS2_9GAMM|nr:MAG: hypothetical protein C0630_04715 [Sedimenticola selenatireducens]